MEIVPTHKSTNNNLFRLLIMPVIWPVLLRAIGFTNGPAELRSSAIRFYPTVRRTKTQAHKPGFHLRLRYQAILALALLSDEHNALCSMPTASRQFSLTHPGLRQNALTLGYDFCHRWRQEGQQKNLPLKTFRLAKIEVRKRQIPELITAVDGKSH